ncbi:MAG TPA: glycosyltransferase, partial [Thermoanaerobaculia bacterium]|nr:glycosyltransferase [Thermoanaerobaculia bacterium]
LRTLEGLAAAGVRATLVAPLDPRRHALESVAAALAPWCEPQLVLARPAGAASTLLRSAGHRQPLTISRHTLPPVRRRVEGLLAARRFDVIHAEQLQALPQALAPARAGHRPVVLRAQNVESALWAAAPGRPLALEARRLAAWEGRAVAEVDATAALTAIDAAALRRLAAAAGSPQARVVEVPAPFAAELPPGPPGLAGKPAVAVLGSLGWRPNEDAVAWFTGEIWPAVRRVLPEAELHVFGIARGSTGEPAGAAASGRDAERGITWHAAPADSAAAFACGSIHVVPLRFGSGVRMKVLEAWARGVPVIATPEGAAGLDAADGVELLVARDAAGFAAACRRLCEEPGLAAALAAAGRAALRRRHDPATVARRLLDLYAEVQAAARR